MNGLQPARLPGNEAGRLPPEPEGVARSVTDSFSAHVAVLDENGTILTTNRAWREFAQTNPPVSVNVCEGANYLAVCDRAAGRGCEDSAVMAAGIRAVLRRQEREFVLEYSCHSPDEKRWFEARVTRFLDDGVPRIVVAHTNLTQHRRDEASLRQSMIDLAIQETRLRTLVQTIPDLVWLKDLEGVFLACNPAFERLMGSKMAKIVGRTDYDFFDQELADFFRANDRKAMAAGEPTVNEEWLTFASDGHRALCETIKTPMLDAEGHTVGVLGIARDITERHVAQEKLKATLAELARSNEELERVRRRHLP